MNNAFNTNFKHLILYVSKVATQSKDCPLTSSILSTLIKYLFDDSKRASGLIDQFKENRRLVIDRYGSEDIYVLALNSQDRSLFDHIDLFPESLRTTYPVVIEWFRRFLVSEMDEKYIGFVWGYLKAMDRQANK